VRRDANVAGMYEFSLPTKADKVPAGSDWIHEVKYDGYRMMLIRDQDRVPDQQGRL
jgi:ATP-dependent DNA ligase